jgi:hypothetical protein
MYISERLGFKDESLTLISKPFLREKNPLAFGLNKESAYLVLTHVSAPIVLTVDSVASAMLGQIISIPSPLFGTTRYYSGWLLERSVCCFKAAETTLCNLALVFQKALNPWVPHLFATAAVITPLALAHLNFLPKELLIVPEFMMVPLALVCIDSFLQAVFKEKRISTFLRNEGVVGYALIKPLCHAVAMRALQIGLQSLLSNVIKAQLFMILGVQLSVAGVVVSLIMAAISFANQYSCDFNPNDELIKQGLFFSCYEPLFQAHGFLASVYAEVLFTTVQKAVRPMIASVVETTYKNTIIAQQITDRDQSSFGRSRISAFRQS